RLGLGALSFLHPPGLAVLLHLPPRRGRHPKNHPAPEAEGNRDSHHRSQRHRDVAHHRSSLHHRRRRDLSEGGARRIGRRRPCPGNLSRGQLPAELGSHMALEQKLSLRLATKLVMTPSLQQAIKLLQMSKLELVEEITQELTLNPVLEEGAEPREEQLPEPEVRTDDPGPPAEAPVDGVNDSFQEIDYQSYFQDYLDAGYSPRTPSEDVEAPPLENILTRPQGLAEHLLWQLAMNVPDG